MCPGDLGRLGRLAEPLNNGGVGHPTAFTHRLQSVPASALFQRVHERGHDAGAAGAQRVTDGDGAAVDVGLGEVGPGVVGPGKRRVKGATVRRWTPSSTPEYLAILPVVGQSRTRS
jgi:hypothetical protein